MGLDYPLKWVSAAKGGVTRGPRFNPGTITRKKRGRKGKGVEEEEGKEEEEEEGEEEKEMSQ